MPPDRQTDPTDAELPTAREHREHRVPRGPFRLYARDHPGGEPAVVLLHGFPDDLHLYDRLVPELAGRRVVSFDFLGWGASDKPTGYPYTAANQTGDLDAVIQQLGLGSVVLVAHDASGPPAITWALDHPRQAAGLVLLNTYYADMPGLRDPQVIWLFSTPLVRSVARPVSRLFGDMVFRAMYRWQVGRFFRDPQVRQRSCRCCTGSSPPLPAPTRPSSASTATCDTPWLPGPRRCRGCAASTARSGSSSAPPTPTSTPGWHAASTSCSRPQSCSCWKAPATTCRWTNQRRSPG
jgi:pimeloyl-ACP methyl ester carboxylesterase